MSGRFVIVHDGRGVYLEPGLYSKDAGPKPPFAPTYPAGVIEESQAWLFGPMAPDVAGCHASKQACKDAGIDVEGW